LKPATPGQRAKLGLLVAPALKTRIDGVAVDRGSTQSIEGARLIELGLDMEKRLGGPRVVDLLETLARAAIAKYGDHWVFGWETYHAVTVDLWPALLVAARPVVKEGPLISRSEAASVAAELPPVPVGDHVEEHDTADLSFAQLLRRIEQLEQQLREMQGRTKRAAAGNDEGP
jgi:hypothetical protein